MAASIDHDTLHALLAALPVGRWASYGDVATVAGTNGNGLGSHFRSCKACSNTWRVLTDTGAVSDGYVPTDAGDARTQAGALAAEGVAIADGIASPSQRLRGIELARLVPRRYPSLEWVRQGATRRHLPTCDHWDVDHDSGQLIGPAPTLASELEMLLPPCAHCAERARRSDLPARGWRARARQFWWASQRNNHDIAMRQRTLWTVPGRRRRLPDKELLQEMLPGDLVFHYASGSIRAVSEVVEAWRPAIRPPGYLSRTHDGDDGWLVEVEPIAEGLDLDRHEVSKVIRWGSPGPLDSRGVPQQIYLARIRESDAASLLARLGMGDGATDELPLVEVPRWAGSATDRVALVQARSEQSALRRALLSGRSVAPCGLCSTTLPAELLVAAHIVPRARLDDLERRAFGTIAMLACALGCDALFELGLVVVDDGGVVRRGARASSHVDRWIDALEGRKAPAHSAVTQELFARHRATHT